MTDHEPPFDNSREIALDLLSPELLFDVLDAHEWITRNRVHSDDGRLDIFDTAKNLGIPLHMDDESKPISTAKAWITGLKPAALGEPIEISFGTTTREQQLRVSFGHELGHYFLFQNGLTIEQSTDWEEPFCEYFGRQFAVPQEYLTDVTDVDGEAIHALSERFSVEDETVILQLIEAHKLPQRVFVDSGIGPTKNPLYNNKIERVVVCADCEAGIPHDAPDDAFADEHFVLDMTAYDLANHFSIHTCTPEMVFDLDNLKRINEMYGTWTPEDDSAVELDNAERAERWQRMRAMLGKMAFDDPEQF